VRVLSAHEQAFMSNKHREAGRHDGDFYWPTPFDVICRGTAAIGALAEPERTPAVPQLKRAW
jgi:hypothetical protein